MKHLVPRGTHKRMGKLAPTPIEPQEPLDDMDVLTVVHGRNLYRARAVVATFAMWDKYQAPMPDVYVAWCYKEDNEPEPLKSMPDYPWLHKVRLPQYDLDDKVFKKEGLLDYLISLTKRRFILTIDADVWSENPLWLRLIRNVLAKNWHNVCQCYAHFRDTLENQQEWAWAAHILENHDPVRCKHPGLGWAFSRKWVKAHNGVPVFNPWHPCGSGDCAFVLEHFTKGDQLKSYASKYEKLPYFQRVFRGTLPEARLTAVDVEVWHQNHTQVHLIPDYATNGTFADRAYRWSREALNKLGDLSQYLYLDENGVPMLRDPTGPFAQMLQRKEEMQDAGSTARVITECFAPPPLPGLPDPSQGPFHTMSGIGDHVLLATVMKKMREAYPDAPLSVYLSRKGVEPWFDKLCPGVTFSDQPGEKLVWRHGFIPHGHHAIERYGCTIEDITLPFDPPEKQSAKATPRIAFVTQHEAHLGRKKWPHWERLASLIREKYGVAPLWIGVDTFAKPMHTLPTLLASMDVVVCTEGMASHICFAIRKRAIVLLTGAIDAQALCYPGFHTVLQGACKYTSFCDCYARPLNKPPQCNVECMSSITPEAVESLVEQQLRPKIVNVHFLSPNPKHGNNINAGDFNAGAARYMPNMIERSFADRAIPCDIVVFGGGGMYQQVTYKKAAEYRKLGAKVVVWGAGIVTEDRETGMSPFNWRVLGDTADLCGLREDSPWEYTPCPSCMSNLFERFNRLPATEPVVYYSHPDKPVQEGTPRMTNYETTDLARILQFLAQGETVVTSSYHGGLWAHWLGRKVQWDGPAAEELAQSGPMPSLTEARAATQEFYRKVLRLA